MGTLRTKLRELAEAAIENDCIHREEDAEGFAHDAGRIVLRSLPCRCSTRRYGDVQVGQCDRCQRLDDLDDPRGGDR